VPARFGTDGVRGVANVELTAPLAYDLAVAAAQVLVDGEHSLGDRPVALLGRDPRPSGEFLEAAVTAGLAAAGVDVVSLGVLPTPAVACLTRLSGADFAVMISASHNPMPDNGIKFFGAGGAKLTDALEGSIEQLLGVPVELPIGAGVGRVRTDPGAVEQYLQATLATLDTDLGGLHVIVDCANGAAVATAPEALRRAGARVEAIGIATDGEHINDGCGSTHLEVLQQRVVEAGADVGIAHDGDADRCLAVDDGPGGVDGDAILAILGLALHEQDRLTGDTVVATVMSNLGLGRALESAGIALDRTDVGDRYVLEALQRDGHVLGGEQSGHVILLDHATTGDGMLTALHLLARMATTGRSLADLASVLTRYPQVLLNVRGVDRSRVATDPGVAEAVAAAEAALGGDGRVLLRPSGTEPLVRVMVEAATPEIATDVAATLAAAVRERLSTR
jgi:phosphoglucosamine mutase